MYQSVLQTCIHSPVNVPEQEYRSNASASDEEEVGPGEGDLDAVNKFLSNDGIEEERPKQMEIKTSYLDYLPLWRQLLGLSNDWKSGHVSPILI